MMPLGFLFASCLNLAMSATTLSKIMPVRLRCEYQASPLGLDSTAPRLSWWLDSSQQGERQSAYQVVVASSAAKLAAGSYDLWDSGRIASGENVHVVYGGKALKSAARCFWKVRVWDVAKRPSEWSAPALWTMGLLRPRDWPAKWIAATEHHTTAGPLTVFGYHALEATSPNEMKWVQVDLGRSRPIDSVVLHPPLPSGWEKAKGFGFPVRFRIEISDDPGFSRGTTVVDNSQADFPNPANRPCSFDAKRAKGRYVRVWATKLWNRGSGAAPYCFALAELEVRSNGENISLHAPVEAKDSVEASGWSRSKLTDGERIRVPSQTGEEPGNAAVMLRREFGANKKVLHATATLCGLGYSELMLNGKKIGDHVLDPGFTDFARRVLYVTYDVTNQIQAGKNVVGILLGGGWYNLGTPDLFGFEKAPWAASPRALFQLSIEYVDGTSETVLSDDSWSWSTGAITFNGVRGGETIDARADKPGWSKPSFLARGWRPVTIVKPPQGKLASQQHPPIRAHATLRTVKLTRPKPGVYVFDLGRNIAGWARIKTRGARGTKVVLQYNEKLHPDGTVDMQHLSSHTYGRFQTDEFILGGNGEETFEPRFTYHGFRYVQVTGLTEAPTPETLVGRWVTTDPDPAGTFECSNPRLNALDVVIRDTFLNNMHGIPTDCPQREKMGWMDDGCVDMEAIFLHLDTPNFYRKWFEDMRDAQDPNGHVTDIVPTSGWGKTRPDGSPGEMADPWWGGAIVIAPWKIYQQYGDVRVLENGYLAMKAYVDYLSSTAKDGFVDWGLGDWLDESAGGGGRRVPVVQTSTACAFYCARIVSQTAALLANPVDAEHYAALASKFQIAFEKRFFDPATGLYAPDSQAAQAIPLYVGLTPVAQREKVLDALKKNIEVARHGHISAGIVGSLYVFHALMEGGRDDIAYRLLTQEEYPGWLYMLNHGATSLWEDWKGENSLNHPTLGCVGFWLYQGLGGIRPDPSGPGFKHIVIKPGIVDGLDWVKCSYDSVRGRIETAWRRDHSKLSLKVVIPVTSTATIYFPTSDVSSVTESGGPITSSRHVKLIRSESGYGVYEVGSGTYTFEGIS